VFYDTDSEQKTPSARMTSSSSSSAAAAVGVASVGVSNDGDHAQLFTSHPVFIRKPQSASVIEGDPVKFTCQVQGRPRPQVHWEKDGKPVDLTSDPRVKVKVILLLR